MEPLVPRLAAATGAEVQLIPVENRLFGPTVTTAGLLPGEDIREALAERADLDAVFIPAEALNDDDLFIDSVAFDALAGALAPRLIPAYHLSGAFAQL
jgi:NifB/MoaA-like Fe-S oxidoreductase